MGVPCLSLYPYPYILPSFPISLGLGNGGGWGQGGLNFQPSIGHLVASQALQALKVGSFFDARVGGKHLPVKMTVVCLQTKAGGGLGGI